MSHTVSSTPRNLKIQCFPNISGFIGLQLLPYTHICNGHRLIHSLWTTNRKDARFTLKWYLLTTEVFGAALCKGSWWSPDFYFLANRKEPTLPWPYFVYFGNFVCSYTVDNMAVQFKSMTRTWFTFYIIFNQISKTYVANTMQVWQFHGPISVIHILKFLETK